jgi:hypothetical protein
MAVEQEKQRHQGNSRAGGNGQGKTTDLAVVSDMQQFGILSDGRCGSDP